MGKKKITKQEVKPVKQEKIIEKSQKKPKKGGKQQSNNQILIPDFFNRLESFQTYYKEVLELKSQTNNLNINDQIASVNNRVRDRFLKTQSEILQSQIKSLEKWIAGEQQKLQKQINEVKKCYSRNEQSLKSTGSFTDAQVKSQILPILKKIQEKQTTYNNYGDLLVRAAQIYKWNSKDQKQEQVVNDNNDLDVDL